MRSDSALITSCGSRVRITIVRVSSLSTLASEEISRSPTTTRSGCRSARLPSGSRRRQLGVVDEDRSGADDDRVAGRAAAMHVGTGGLAGDPLAAAVGRRAAAVDTGGEFPGDMRKPGALLVQPLAQRSACDVVGQHACDHLHTRLGKPGRSPRSDRIGVVDGVDNRRNTRGDKGVDAWRRSAVMVARLEGDHGRAARGASTRPPQRHHFRVGAAGRLGCADADGLAIAIQDDRADRRIGIGAALDQLGLLDGQPHRGVEAHSRRCFDAVAACLRSASTAAAGSSAL